MDTPDLKTLVERVLADKVLTTEEQKQIMSAVLSDQQVSPDEHQLLEMIVDKLSTGEITVGER